MSIWSKIFNRDTHVHLHVDGDLHVILDDGRITINQPTKQSVSKNKPLEINLDNIQIPEVEFGDTVKERDDG